MNPLRGQVWMTQFDPQVGAEMKDPHPAVVVSDDNIGVLPLKVVVPLTGAENIRRLRSWHVLLQPSALNGLTKPSVADTFQVKSIDTRRLIRLMGALSAQEFDDVMEGVLLCLGVPAG